MKESEEVDMKSFCRGILTVFITIALIGLGVSFGLKGMLIDTADTLIKKEVKNSIVDVVEDYTNDSISEEVIREVENTIENNEEIKKIVDAYYRSILDVLSDKETELNINVTEELTGLIDEGEKVLKDYGIEITPEEKQELLSIVSSEELNDLASSAITEAKQNMTSETKMILDVYQFLTSSELKIILILSIVVFLLFIALLKKSVYQWFSNFAIAAISSGIVIGILFPFLVDSALKLLEEESLNLSLSSFTTYGYILIGLGILSIIVNLVASNLLKKDSAKVKKSHKKKEKELEKSNSEEQSNEDDEEEI